MPSLPELMMSPFEVVTATSPAPKTTAPTPYGALLDAAFAEFRAEMVALDTRLTVTLPVPSLAARIPLPALAVTLLAVTRTLPETLPLYVPVLPGLILAIMPAGALPPLFRFVPELIVPSEVTFTLVGVAAPITVA